MENKKKSKINLITIVLLLIIVALIVVGVKMYTMLIEMQNNMNTNSDDVINENVEEQEKSAEYEIEGIYDLYVEGDSCGVSYYFSEGKVIFSENASKEGTYIIVDNKIKITYNSAFDPDGEPMDEFEKQEELTIVDNNTLINEYIIDGETKYSIYTSLKDYFIVYNGVEIEKKAGIQSISDMKITNEAISKYNTTYYNYENGKYFGTSVGTFGEETYEGCSVVNTPKKIAISQKYNAFPRQYEEIKELPEKLSDMADYTTIDMVAIDLDWDGKREYIVCWTLNYEEGTIGDGEPIASSGIMLLDNDYKKVADLVTFEDNMNNKEEKVFLTIENVEFIDLDNDGEIEVITEIPQYEGSSISIIKYKNRIIEGKTDIKADLKP